MVRLLAGNQIQDEGLTMFAEGLRGNTTVEELYLDREQRPRAHARPSCIASPRGIVLSFTPTVVQ